MFLTFLSIYWWLSVKRGVLVKWGGRVKLQFLTQQHGKLQSCVTSVWLVEKTWGFSKNLRKGVSDWLEHWHISCSGKRTKCEQTTCSWNVFHSGHSAHCAPVWRGSLGWHSTHCALVKRLPQLTVVVKGLRKRVLMNGEGRPGGSLPHTVCHKLANSTTSKRLHIQGWDCKNPVIRDIPNLILLGLWKLPRLPPPFFIEKHRKPRIGGKIVSLHIHVDSP